MTPSVQCTTILSTGTFIFLALLSSSVAAYIPSVHSHDSAIVAIEKPSVIQPTSKKEEPTPEPNTIAPSIHASITRTKWGTDYEHPEEYWFDDRIHTLGNHGFGGAVHAALAPFSTKIIDLAAYNGEDIRLKVSDSMSQLSFIHSIWFSYCRLCVKCIVGTGIVRSSRTAKGTNTRSMLWGWHFNACSP